MKNFEDNMDILFTNVLKKIVKYESKLSNLEAENKKLKKELIIQKRKKRDNRTVRIRQ